MKRPSGTTAAALALLARARTADEIRGAVAAAAPGPELREALLARYDQLAAAPKKDASALLRAELLIALRPLVLPADGDRLARAILTYEFGTLSENASRLRGAAVLALAEVDADLADVYATHLLGDGYTESMSGEPALTALQYLASRQALLPIYLYALSGSARQELLATALRSLAGLPAPLVLRLAESLLTSQDDIALVGLFDLIVAHDEPAAFAGFVNAFARDTQRLDVLAFAAAEIVAHRREPLIAALLEARSFSSDRQRRAVLDEALSR